MIGPRDTPCAFRMALEELLRDISQREGIDLLRRGAGWPLSDYWCGCFSEKSYGARTTQSGMTPDLVIARRPQADEAITDGQFDFGPWEQICYGEFDGRRRQTKSLKELYASGFIAW